EVHAGPDVPGFQFFDEPASIDREPTAAHPDDVQVPGMPDSWPDRGKNDLRRPQKPTLIERCVALANLEKPVGLLELLETDRRGNVGHVVLVARVQDLVVPGTL